MHGDAHGVSRDGRGCTGCTGCIGRLKPRYYHPVQTPCKPRANAVQAPCKRPSDRPPEALPEASQFFGARPKAGPQRTAFRGTRAKPHGSAREGHRTNDVAYTHARRDLRNAPEAVQRVLQGRVRALQGDDAVPIGHRAPRLRLPELPQPSRSPARRADRGQRVRRERRGDAEVRRVRRAARQSVRRARPAGRVHRLQRHDGPDDRDQRAQGLADPEHVQDPRLHRPGLPVPEARHDRADQPRRGRSDRVHAGVEGVHRVAGPHAAVPRAAARDQHQDVLPDPSTPGEAILQHLRGRLPGAQPEPEPAPQALGHVPAGLRRGRHPSAGRADQARDRDGPEGRVGPARALPARAEEARRRRQGRPRAHRDPGTPADADRRRDQRALQLGRRRHQHLRRRGLRPLQLRAGGDRHPADRAAHRGLRALLRRLVRDHGRSGHERVRRHDPGRRRRRGAAGASVGLRRRAAALLRRCRPQGAARSRGEGAHHVQVRVGHDRGPLRDDRGRDVPSQGAGGGWQ